MTSKIFAKFFIVFFSFSLCAIGHAGVLKLGDFINFIVVPTGARLEYQRHPPLDLSRRVDSLHEIVFDVNALESLTNEFIEAFVRNTKMNGTVGRVFLNAGDLSVIAMSNSATEFLESPIILMFLARQRELIFQKRVATRNSWRSEDLERNAIAALPFFRRLHTIYLPQALSDADLIESRTKAVEDVPVRVIDNILRTLRSNNLELAGRLTCGSLF